eukprot:s1051_g12.t1
MVSEGCSNWRRDCITVLEFYQAVSNWDDPPQIQCLSWSKPSGRSFRHCQLDHRCFSGQNTGSPSRRPVDSGIGAKGVVGEGQTFHDLILVTNKNIEGLRG